MGNPADGTGMDVWHGQGDPSPMTEPPVPTGPRKPYRVTAHAKHADTALPPGTIVMLYEHEVCAHHEAVDVPKPVAPVAKPAASPAVAVPAKA